MAEHVLITGLNLQIGELLKQLYEYGRHVARARKQICELCSELLSLRGILSDIKSQRPGKSADNGLSDLVTQARILVDDMLRDLTPHLMSHRTILESLSWPLETSGVDVTLQWLCRLKDNLLLIMMGGVPALEEDAKAQAEAVTADLRPMASDAVSRIQGENRAVHPKLVEFLAPVSPEVAHRMACAASSSTQSAEWFIRGPLRA